MTTTTKAPAAQVELVNKAAATAAANPPIRLISRAEVLDIVGVSYASLWGWIKDGSFPPGRALSPGTKKGRICWIESEVQAWMLSLPVRLPKGSKQRAA
jgi:predicted DNA-binding transcriptional regulator AlpA